MIAPRRVPTPRRRRALIVAATATAALAAALGLAPAVRAASPQADYTTQLLHFEVHVGPHLGQTCDVLGEMYKPVSASTSNRVPAILTTNGFGGSYTDQKGLAAAFAAYGYATLTYSGLGFGGSGCPITLDSPTYDGAAASQLISFLGGENGIAFTNAAHTRPVPGLDYIIHDARDHDGHADRYDPRVGMIGGSYGGEIQFAAAAVDPRIDTIVPIITWNDLNYSLAPNNANLPANHVTSNTPGVAKSTWALFFSADGILDGLTNAGSDPGRLVGCPNFAAWVCPGLAQAGTLGFPAPATTAQLGAASVATYMNRVRIPTLLLQGEDDTLFNLNEAVANYEALRAQGTPVSMIWQSWGHSSLTPASGEINLDDPNPVTQYETGRILAWLDHYLKGSPVSTGPGFAYFRNWISYHGIATPAYASAPSYPVGQTATWYLSGDGKLEPSATQLTVGTQQFLTGPLGAPTSTAPLDAVGGSIPEINVPGTYAAWTSPVLRTPVDVAGIPILHVQFLAPTAAISQVAGPAGDLVVFAKIYDVSAQGQASLINGLVAPARINNVGKPVTITLPGIVHRFAAGDRIEVVIAGGDINYRGGIVAAPVVVATGNTGQALYLPEVS